ncbi:MAG: hypothetical protein R6U54_02060, partial [Candidatus Omnitrophota bacterium]
AMHKEMGGKMKIFKPIVFATIFSLLSLSISAQSLKGMIYVSNQMEEFDQTKIVREYVIGETAYCAFLVQGFSTDANRAVNLAADIKFIDPHGKTLFEEKNYAKSTISVVQDQKIITLDSSFDISFEQSDPLGMYTLEALIKDNIDGTQNTVKTTLLLFDSEKSKNIIMSPIRDAKHLDELWAEYLRSKNPWAIKRIISALRLRKESPHFEDALIAEAAKWSLEANAKEHPEVLSICKQSLEYTKGVTKKLLQEIINNVENKN